MYAIKLRRLLKLTILTGLGFAISTASVGVGIVSVMAKTPSPAPVVVQSRTVTMHEQRGRELYQLAQFAEAAAVWQQVAQVYRAAGEQLRQASALSNLSLAYQQLGQWEQAQEAITESLELLQDSAPSGRGTTELGKSEPVLAQALNTLGRLKFALGQPEQALSSWQQAAERYARSNDETGVLRSQINQAEALQELGFQRRALDLLSDVNQALQTQPDSHLKTVGLRSYGDLLRLAGEFRRSRQILEQSLAIAQQLELSDDAAAALLSLGNTARAQQELPTALKFYQQAAAMPASQSRQVSIALAQMSLLLDLDRFEEAQSLAPQIQSQLAQLLPSHAAITARIHFARNLFRLDEAQVAPGDTSANAAKQTIAQNLAAAAGQAQDLGDQKMLSYALGFLGQVYVQTEQQTMAQDLLEQALLLAQEANAPEIAYRWQWQLGRVLKAQEKTEKAIAAYSEAVALLQSLRSDLAANNREVQFSFQASIEPVYRELVSLLLPTEAEIPQADLVKARNVMESLRVAELDNFLRQACITAQPVPIDQLDPRAAALYPIVLGDRLELILSLPASPLKHYTTSISETDLETVIEQLRYTLVIRSRRQFFAPAQQLYDWLIRPVAADLAASGANTLVFVLDGPLRNVPMAALHDGKQYLVEQYAIALSSSLQLLAPKTLQKTSLKTLAVGLTQETQGFAPLDYVNLELEEIKEHVSKSVILLDREFTEAGLREEIKFSDFPIVHIATHGQFSSNLDQTFLLAWDGQIDVKELDNILQARGTEGTQAIELLVLSACETAAGDKRAALGLAGMAVQAGARSTAATLWTINDRSTAEFMSQFYQELGYQQLTKAEALRQTQLSFIQHSWYKHPFYWAPYVLVGNWQ